MAESVVCEEVSTSNYDVNGLSVNESSILDMARMIRMSTTNTMERF